MRADHAVVTDTDRYAIWVKHPDETKTIWFWVDTRDEALDVLDQIVKTLDANGLIDAGATRVTEKVTYTTLETHVGAPK
jgi:hypothetical protein